MASGVTETQQFYSRWARLYDALATRTPGLDSIRDHAVDRLGLSPGDTVVEMGCGTGANFPALRAAVGDAGTVVGVDVAPGMLTTARERIIREGWRNVHVVAGDATRPPVGNADAVDTVDTVDAVFASFVSGMLSNPASAVHDWADLVGDGGKLGLLDLTRSTEPTGRPLNLLFAGLVFAALPSKRRSAVTDAPELLDRRVAAAEDALRERCVDVHESTRALGFARVAAGTVDESS